MYLLLLTYYTSPHFTFEIHVCNQMPAMELFG